MKRMKPRRNTRGKTRGRTAVTKRSRFDSERGPITSRRRRNAPPELDRVDTIRTVATRFFREKGYHAATLRGIAQEVGIEAPSLYNHFPSKQELLTDILVATMEDLIDVVRAAVENASDGPVEKLRAATIAYVRFHEDRLAEASISDTELRALEPRNLEHVFALRHEFDLVFKKIIQQGAKEGAFKVEDPSITTMAVLSICARLPSWYRPGGRLDLDRIAHILADCVVRAVGGE